MRAIYFLSVIFSFNSIFRVHASDIGLNNYPNAMEHAPAGVMGDHSHQKGELDVFISTYVYANA